MKKTLVTLALAAVSALMLSACNGGSGGSSGVAPLPNGPAASGHHVRRLDVGSGSLHAGGATFPAYGYNLGDQPVGLASNPAQPTPGPGSILAEAKTTFPVYYCLTGSGYGRAEFETNNGTATTACAALGQTHTGFGAETDPLDFVGSDVALPSTECCASGTTYYTGRIATTPSWGQPFELPTFGGPIVFGYNASTFTPTVPIKLSTWTYCAIANGTIGNWNDGAITADNGGSITGGVSVPIDFYYRSDGSGTTYLFENKLNNSTSGCNQTFKKPYNKAPYAGPGRSAAWSYGIPGSSLLWTGPTGKQASGSTFTGESGNPGVIDAIQGDPDGTGYVEGAWAAAAGVAQASLQSTNGKKSFISPTNKTAVAGALSVVTSASIDYGVGSDGTTLSSTTPWCQLYIPPSTFVTPGAKDYPIVGLSYWLFYGNNNGVHVANKQTLIKFIASKTANTLLNPLEYSPLATSVHTAILDALKGTATQTACLQ
jgi:ABC-type phosphate transport system substrate-binding protein